MKKTVFSVLCAASLCAVGCMTFMSPMSALAAETETEADLLSVYVSPDGWSVRLDESFFEVIEDGEHRTQFTYSQDAPGACFAGFSYIEGKSAEEVIKERSDEWGDAGNTQTFESTFPGTEDVKSLYAERIEEEGVPFTQVFLVRDYQEGAFEIEVFVHTSGVEEIDMPISDAFEGLIDSISFSDETADIVREVFSAEYLDLEEKELDDARVTEVELVDAEMRAQLLSDEFFEGVSDDAIFAYVTYSVKPSDLESSMWLAGNGELEGDWIVDKTACVCVDRKEDAYVLVSCGTGW